MLNPHYRQWLLAASTLVLIHLSAPGASLPWLAIIWPLPLLIATRSASPLKAAFIVAACLWFGWLESVWWLLPAIMDFAGTGKFTSAFLLLTVTLSCALPYALATFVWRYFACRQVGDGLFLPAIIFTVSLSWLPSLLPGSPFHGLYRLPIFIQSLGLGGLPLLLFLLFALNFSLLKVVDSIPHRTSNNRQKQIIAEAITPILLFALMLCYGALQLQQLRSATDQQSLRVALVQPNLSRTDSTQVLFDATRRLHRSSPDLDLIVWPEFPAAFSAIDNPQDRTNTLKLSRVIDTPLLINSGYVYRRAADGRRLEGYFNSNQLINNGAIVDSYHKQVLVPFFEYLPLAEHWPNLKHYFPQTLQYQPGLSSKLLALNSEIQLISTICYEVIFSSIVREFVDNGGNIIINPVSDSWFGESQASAHHFALALFKTVEFRVPLVRAANSGISAMVTAGGEIIDGTETQLMTDTVRSSTVAIPAERSFYAKHGDIFLYAISTLLVFFSLLLLKGVGDK